MQRKGVEVVRLEEGQPTVSSYTPYDDDWRKRNAPPPPRQQGWSPIIVLLVGALLLSIFAAFYEHQQAAEKALALQSLATSFQAKSTEYAQKMAAAKHRLEELDTGKKKVEEREKTLTAELAKVHEELTTVKHSLHEEQTKALRTHRDNVDLHKRLKVKSNELKVLEDQTRTFEKEMNQLSKTIHALQGGDAAQEGSSSTDYQMLYKKQEEQQQRLKDKEQGGSGSKDSVGGSSSDGDEKAQGSTKASASGHHKSTRHKKEVGSGAGSKEAKAAEVATAKAAVNQTAEEAAGGAGEQGFVDNEHEYKDVREQE